MRQKPFTLVPPYLGSPKAIFVMLFNYGFELVMIIDCTPNGGSWNSSVNASWDDDVVDPYAKANLRVSQGAGSCWFCMRLSAAAAMVLRLSTVKSNSGAVSSSSPGKSSSWSSWLLFRNLLQGSNEQHMVLFTDWNKLVSQGKDIFEKRNLYSSAMMHNPVWSHSWPQRFAFKNNSKKKILYFELNFFWRLKKNGLAQLLMR